MVCNQINAVKYVVSCRFYLVSDYQRENIDKTLAEKIVNEKDAARVDFYKTFFEYNGPEDPRQFHLSINTTLIKLDPTISMILAAAKAFKEGLLTH